ncbi:hypothetical protein CR513_13695, partial [Mucuna pruriens]
MIATGIGHLAREKRGPNTFEHEGCLVPEGSRGATPSGRGVPHFGHMNANKAKKLEVVDLFDIKQMIEYKIEKVLVDQGTLANILYKNTFWKLELPKSQLEDCPGTLIRFASEQVEICSCV